MALPYEHLTPSGTAPVPLRRPVGRPPAIYAAVDVAVARLMDISIWCERAERIDADGRAADAIHDLHLALAKKKVRRAADEARALGQEHLAEILDSTWRSMLIAEEHDARKALCYAAVMRIVARIAKRVRGLCSSLEHRLGAARRGGEGAR